MEIKFCAARTLRDVHIAKVAGATEMGVISRPDGGAYASTSGPKEISYTVEEEWAACLFQAAASQLTTVLVARSKTPKDIAEMTWRLRPDRLQLSETDDTEAVATQCESLGYLPLIAQVVHISDSTSLEIAFSKVADIMHFDSAGRHPGGNNVTHNWEISREFSKRAHANGKRVALAGGLNKDNLVRAVEAVEPDIVDFQTALKDSYGNYHQGQCHEIVQAVRDSVERKNEAL